MDDDFIYSLSYNEILSFPDSERSVLIESFYSISSKISEQFLSCDKSLKDMLLEQEMYIDSNISNYIFLGETVKYYPNIKIVRAKKNYLCAFTGDEIKFGSEIIC